MRKLARVGRPPRREWSSARTSDSRSVDHPAVAGGVERPGQLALELRHLPRMVGIDVGQSGYTGAQRHHPLLERAGRRERGDAAVEAVDQLGEAPEQLEVAAADVVERQAAADVAVVVATHRGAEQQPVEPCPPGVVGEALHVEPTALLGVEAPADAGRADPVGDAGEVVVVEREPAAYDVGACQVEHLAGGDPAAGQLDQPGGDPEQGVGARQRPVGEPHPQPVGGVAVLDHALEPEPGRDQRRVGLDVGAHDEDVARLEGGVVVEQPDQHLAEHVDLARRAVAGVDLEAVVVDGGHPTRPHRLVGSAVGTKVVLEPAEQRRPVLDLGGRGDVDPHAVEDPAQLTGVAAQRGEQRVVDPLGGRVVVAGDDAADSSQRVPERGRGLRQPEVDVASLAESRQQLDLGHRQPGVAEQGQPVGQVEPGITVAQPPHGLGVPHVGRRLTDPDEQPTPELGLPGQVAVEG